MYCILSSVTQENTQELSGTMYNHDSSAILLEVIYKVGKLRIEEKQQQKKLFEQRSSMHELDTFRRHTSVQQRRRAAFQTHVSAMVSPRQITLKTPRRHNWVHLLPPRKKKKKNMISRELSS